MLLEQTKRASRAIFWSMKSSSKISAAILYLVPVSALTGEGVEELIDSLLLVAEVSELVADPSRDAIGVVVEGTLDRQRGPVATVIVRSGTVGVGDTVVAGDKFGRVRRMVDGFGKEVESAGPSAADRDFGVERGSRIRSTFRSC